MSGAMNDGAMNDIEELGRIMSTAKTAPTLEEMQRRTLLEKGINGPTGAHVIEEIHTPLNIAYVTFTTGTTAFQNIVGVTASEIPGRIKAARKLFPMAGIKEKDKILFTYPLLVSVFSKDALTKSGVEWFFLDNSSRDAFLLSLCREKPQVVVGESAFLRSAIEDAKKLGLEKYLPKELIILAAGTPLDLELPAVAKTLGWKTHDLYGCQEFGWLTLDGIPLRDDISLVDAGLDFEGYADLFVGGLPTSDRFLISEKGHICNNEGNIITYNTKRMNQEPSVYIEEITANAIETATRLVKTILRIKGKIIKVSDNIKLSSTKNVVSVRDEKTDKITLIDSTDLLGVLLSAQIDYQSNSKRDAAWTKIGNTEQKI